MSAKYQSNFLQAWQQKKKDGGKFICGVRDPPVLQRSMHWFLVSAVPKGIGNCFSKMKRSVEEWELHESFFNSQQVWANGEKTSLCNKSCHTNESFPHFSRTLPSTVVLYLLLPFYSILSLLPYLFFLFRNLTPEHINEKAIRITCSKRSPGPHIMTNIYCGVRTNRD